ncbi:immunity protein TriTu family protein [Paenibacillus illinoisensis]|uniref:immunity protein TriTu family protein n=1 Tax=Paenibacillus illinoisensis TaxID=59845 RepID=UPI003D2ADA83
MLQKKFRQWAEQKAGQLQRLNITTEPVNHGHVNEQDIPDPSTGFVHESECAMGQVTVWESGQMEYEVINIETEELILWKYIEQIQEETPDFDKLLQIYFQVLQTGVNP